MFTLPGSRTLAVVHAGERSTRSRPSMVFVDDDER